MDITRNERVAIGMAYGATLTRQNKGLEGQHITAWLEDLPLMDKEAGTVKNRYTLYYVRYAAQAGGNGTYPETACGAMDPGPDAQDMSVQKLLSLASGNADLMPLPEGMTPYSLRHDHEVFQVKDGRSGETTYLVYGWSGNPAATEGCDACLWYYVFKPDMETEVDGGEMDYDSQSVRWTTLSGALGDILSFAYDTEGPDDGRYSAVRMDRLSQEDFGL